MRNIILVVLSIFISATLTFSQPILKSETYDNDADFYIMTVNGQELTQVELIEQYNWSIFKDIAELNLPDGENEIKIRVGNNIVESEDVKFYILVETLPSVKKYEIIPDPENDDPIYLAKFTGSLKAEVYSDGKVIVIPQENDNTDDGGGGSGGGCFIATSKSKG